MRKVIAAINMTLDGFCDHTATIADDEIHQHYTELLRASGVILFGRITYQLMESWKDVLQDPTGNSATDEFAAVIDRIPKIVFSKTLKTVEWESVALAKRDIKEEISSLKQLPGKDILIGSRSIIIEAMNLHLLDEFQICIHPIIAGKGLPLFKNSDRASLNLIGTRTFACGAVILYYRPEN